MDTEAELLRRARDCMAAGEPLDPSLETDLDRLFASYRPRLVSLCTRRTNDPRRGEELAHDAIDIGWSKLDDFRFEGSFFHFLSEIARNLTLNNNRKMHDRLTDDGVLDPVDPEHGALKALRDEEREDVLLQAIADLPRVEQDALYLRFYDGLAYAEITRRLQLGTRTGARNLLVVAKRRLRSRLSEVLMKLGHGSSFFRSTAT